MAEVRTAPVKAQHLSKEEFHASEIPGSFYVSTPQENGNQLFWYRCPCPCAVKGALTVGKDFKPTGPNASWQWNGSCDEPDLKPSVHHVGHWHGWLNNGVWESC